MESTVCQSDQTYEDVVFLRAELIAAKSQIVEMTLEMRKMRGKLVRMRDLHDELLAWGVLPSPLVLSQVPDQSSTPTS